MLFRSAIKTNGKILRSVLSENNSEFILSKIRYINHQKGIWNSHDYRAEYLNMFIPFVHVRKEFENENELRIIHRLDENGWITEEYWQKQPHQVGKFINVNLTNLIEKIVFSPNLSQLEIESIKEKSQNLGYDFQFEKSKFLN